MSIAAVFPGQWSQSVGMLAGLLAASPAAAATLEEAGEALGYDLAALVRDGPAERLNQTEITQPAMLAAGVAAWRAWQAQDGRMAAAMAGHSLGEYTALVCAGAIEFADALRIVRLRGQKMQQAVPQGAGAVAAVLGLDDAAVVEACATAAAQGGVVEAVNFNSPGQVVIAGDSAAVERAIGHAQAAGARRAMILPVSVPVHCALMDPVGAQLEEALQGIEVRPPGVPVYHNIDAAPRMAPDEIRSALARQVHSPVRWVECVQAMRRAGATVMVEFGPGKVLCGLARRIDRELVALPVEDAATLAAALEATGGAQHA
jgi:[acyl-carrier-protein] S-malonyltransferase